MQLPPSQVRFHATSMQLAACLDEHYVEMRIRTDTGQSIVVVCPRDSIFTIGRHIEQMGRACPEIATWQTAMKEGGLRVDANNARFQQ